MNITGENTDRNKEGLGGQKGRVRHLYSHLLPLGDTLLLMPHKHVKILTIVLQVDLCGKKKRL